MEDLKLSGQFPKPPPPNRPLAEYRAPPALEKACLEAARYDKSTDHPGLHLIVLGHVDAGKSSLMGRLLYELGLVDDKKVHKTQKEAALAGKASFAWAWMLDERPEERARGVTIDVAMTRFDTSHRAVTLLDAPGHRDFIPNMIAGAAQADAALLIVDGSIGGFERGFDATAHGGGQTKEHAHLARSLGVSQMAVVITKLDTCGYDQSRFTAIKSTLLPFLTGDCGFKASNILCLPAVGPTGENLVRPPTSEELFWWKGPTVVEVIDQFNPAHRLVELPFRMPVAELGRGSRGGVAASGKVEGGAAQPGTQVLVMPSGQVASIKSIDIDSKPLTLVRAGDGADLILIGIDQIALSVGSVLCHPEWPVKVATVFLARVLVLPAPVPLLKGAQVTLHAHAARETGHISSLLSLLNAKTGEVERHKPRCLLGGQTALVEVTPDRPMCLELYSDYKSLGRIALREGGRTLAVGIITSIVT